MLNKLKDVFKSLHDHDVQYVVIGGIACVLYGVPRATFDLDILIRADRDNAAHLLDALADVGMVTTSLTTADTLLANEITVFNDWIRIDVQTFTPGLDFDAAWESRVTMNFQDQDFYVVSREHLIASKRGANRDIDRDDVRALEGLGG